MSSAALNTLWIFTKLTLCSNEILGQYKDKKQTNMYGAWEEALETHMALRGYVLETSSTGLQETTQDQCTQFLLWELREY